MKFRRSRSNSNIFLVIVQTAVEDYTERSPFKLVKGVPYPSHIWYSAAGLINGSHIETLGYYNPITKETKIYKRGEDYTIGDNIDLDRLLELAQISETRWDKTWDKIEDSFKKDPRKQLDLDPKIYYPDADHLSTLQRLGHRFIEGKPILIDISEEVFPANARVEGNCFRVLNPFQHPSFRDCPFIRVEDLEYLIEMDIKDEANE